MLQLARNRGCRPSRAHLGRDRHGPLNGVDFRRGIRSRQVRVRRTGRSLSRKTRAVPREGMCREQSRRKRTIATSRSDDDRSDAKQRRTQDEHDHRTSNHAGEQTLTVRAQRKKNRFDLTNSFRNGSVAWRPLFVSSDVVVTCDASRKMGARIGARNLAAYRCSLPRFAAWGEELASFRNRNGIGTLMALPQLDGRRRGW